VDAVVACTMLTFDLRKCRNLRKTCQDSYTLECPVNSCVAETLESDFHYMNYIMHKKL